MYFGALPPEINSGRMYAGPGAESMVAAATAWESLAAELRSTAESYNSIIAGLTSGTWAGPASASMASAAAPYATWMQATAAQAEHSAAQAQAAAAAYETAFAATVPPPAIAANRSQLAALMASNLLGQNTSAIAMTEAQYGQMWSQDAAAMNSYAGQSAAATKVTPFSQPPQTTNPGGPLHQLASNTGTAAASAGSQAHSQAAQMFSAVPSALQSGGGSSPLQGLLTSLGDFVSTQSSPSSLAADVELVAKAILPANVAAISALLGLGLGAKALSSAPAAAGISALSAGLGSTTHVFGAAAAGSAGAAASAVSATVGGSGAVGGLAVPPSWATATPEIRLAASALQGAGVQAAPVIAADGSTSMLGQMAAASMAGSAAGNAGTRAAGGAMARIGRSMSDKDKQTPGKLKRVLAELAQDPESVQHWHTDQAHLETLLAQLSKQPGIHAVHLSSGNMPNPAAPKPPSG
jgi:PPE-repeat protein